MSYRLFECVGIELEYMIVRQGALDVLPVADALLRDEGGAVVSEIELGDIAWSNELVAHVLELKTNGPARDLTPVAARFQDHVRRANELLTREGGRLMPTAMHPWMNPRRETTLWAHEHSAVYEAFDRVFGCQGHGWANLQSTHINLPFSSDAEFGALHAAIRAVLPLLPALAASSPVLEGRRTGCMDTRLDVYRHNAIKVPSVTGRVIPEPVYTRADYEREIFAPMYADIAPYDPAGVLQDEFLNARGAIARFSRGSIEIRVLDVQECPAADLAIVRLVVETVRALCEGRLGDPPAVAKLQVAPLETVLLGCIAEGEAYPVRERALLAALAYPGDSATVGELWRHLFERAWPAELDPEGRAVADRLLASGPLARRIVHALGPSFTPGRLREVYGALCDALARGELFAP